MNQGKTKVEQILDPRSDWNLAEDDEPIFVIRANNWKGAMMLALLSRNDPASDMMYEIAAKMREWFKRNEDIPF